MCRDDSGFVILMDCTFRSADRSHKGIVHISNFGENVV